jgi:hypothetical protein
VFRRGQLLRRFRIDVESGRRGAATVKPPSSRLASISRALITPDGQSWAYSYQRTLSDLFVVEKIR